MARLQQSRYQGSSIRLDLIDRINLIAIGVGVIFAALGAGEAVYRVLFLEFDGATDRLPIEILFGLGFAWLTITLVRKIYRQQIETSARMNLIWERNHKIRHAIEAIASPIPANQQAIRVIREEVDRIEWALSDSLSR